MKVLLTIGIFLLSVSVFSKEILVKNTDNSGPGSLREAVEVLANSGDTISIDVKGEIVLLTTLLFDGLSNVTLIGPSAKHSSIKASVAFIGTELVRITGSSNIKLLNLGFVGGSFNGASLISCPVNSGQVIIEHCLFKDNLNSSGNGGAIITNGTTLSIKSCSFINNLGNKGGAIYLESGGVLIENSTFHNNTANTDGGAIYLFSNVALTLKHNTIYQNFATTADAIFSFSASNAIGLTNNAIGQNGGGTDVQFVGPATWNSSGGNRVKKNNGPDAAPWTSVGTDMYALGLVLGLRPTILEDGFGMMYFPITSNLSGLIDLGMTIGGLPTTDMRGAPRSLNGDGVGGTQPDAGACEYTPLRILNSLSSSAIPNSLPWALELAQNTNTINYIEFDIPIVPLAIQPTAVLVLTGNYIIDGFSQIGSAVPGPDINGGSGATAALLPIIIDDAIGLANGFVINGPSNQSKILGLRITNFNNDGISVFGTNTKIEGCEIGIDATNTAQSNTENGIHVIGNNTTIGGNQHWQRNVISGNGQTVGLKTNIYVESGILNTKVQGNFIGISADGLNYIAGGNGFYGILDAGNSTLVGGASAGNVISGNNIAGISCIGCQNLKVFGNIIGLSNDGMTSKQNQTGIFLGSGGSNATIGKSDTLMGNLISGNADVGLWVNQFNNANICNNFIGPNKTGMSSPVTTIHGVYIDHPNATNINVGGALAGEGNLISSNSIGVNVTVSGSGIKILNNYIGVKIDGASALANVDCGIKLQGSTSVQIGQPGAGNLISGHAFGGSAGINVFGGNGHYIQSNIIGLDATGTFSIGNETGIQLIGAIGTVVGGNMSAGQGNVVSGNVNDGIYVRSGSVGTYVQGNLVGTDMTGSYAIPNGFSGLHISDASVSVVGGFFNNRNILSGHSAPNTQGLLLNSIGAGNLIEGNYIGTDITGTLPIPNYNGILIADSHSAQIGGSAGKENYIVASADAGIVIASTTNSIIAGNHIGIGPGAVSASMGNKHGIYIIGKNTVIGGFNVNVIANNQLHGIFIDGEAADSTEILNNIIGTNVANLSGIGNGADGIRIDHGDATLIGTLSGNTIIGNDSAGVHINGFATATEIQFNNIANFSASTLTNYIGVHITGGATLNIIGTTYGAGGNNIGNSITDGVLIENSPGNFIFGNNIGNDGASFAMPNNNGIRLVNSTGTAIGDENYLGNSSFNVISGNLNAGIFLDNSSNATIRGNIIGLNQFGNSQIPNLNGIILTNNSTGNNIGGGANPIYKNTISGNTLSGIHVTSSLNLITNNTIGLTQDGLGAITGQDYGIVLDAGSFGTIVGGDRTTEGNIISSNDLSGILILDQGSQILGNFFGYSSSNTIIGTQPIGIELAAPTAINNIIGAADFGGDEYGNIIMNHSTAGINIHTGAANNFIYGNYIGIDLSNFSSVTQPVGIEIESSAGIDNKIGDDVVGGGNVISGNNVGIRLDGAVHCFIYNNRIGTNVSGSSSSLNANTGIEMLDAGFNTIGGAGLKSNIISGNSAYGIIMSGASSTNNIISGNIIGANLSLSAAVANSIGIMMTTGASNNTIGNPGSGLGNLICGNSIAGIVVDASNANSFFNNRIGVAFNNENGIYFQNGSTNNIFGGDVSQRNIVSNNNLNGIVIADSPSNEIVGNFIGLSPTGISPMPNQVGILVSGSNTNLIGDPVNGNVISANSEAGLVIDNSSSSIVKNNFIGTDSTGNALFAGSGNGIGMVIKNSTNNLIGGDNTGNEENVICNSSGSAIYFEGSSFNTLYGNKIGINKNGTNYLPNGGEGILMREISNENQIGAIFPHFGNCIAANTKGICVRNSDSNIFQNNFIGNNTSGTTTPLIGTNNQLVGIHLDSSSAGNVISALNVISGNDDEGILMTGLGTNANFVIGNHIGVDVAGTLALPNTIGVKVADGASGNFIGQATDGNVISGNDNEGILITGNGTNGNLIAANFVGVNATGNVALPNSIGVTIADSSKLNIIGGSTIGERNIISGNDGGQEILFTGNGVDSNMVKGNLIGLGANETTNIASTNGIKILSGGKSNQIGGPLTDERNYIVNQSANGIWIFGSDQNRIFNNHIGIRPDGAPGPIGQTGVLLENADYNYIGGLNLGTDSANVITNCNTGVSLKAFFLSSYGNPIIGNSIYNNTQQGIDINDDDLVEPVDNIQNLGNNGEIDFPVILTAFSCGSGPTTKVGIEMHYVLTGTYRFDFYSNSSPDATNGEGETFLGGTWFTPTTNPDTMSFDLGVDLPLGTSITSTVTGTLLNTSEFSVNFSVQSMPVGPAVTFSDETCLGADNGSVTITANDAYYFSTDGFITSSFGPEAFNLDSLSPGNYTIGAMYLNGCTVDVPVTLNPGAPLVYQTTIVGDTCGLNTGSISIFSELGSPGPFSYSFGGGAGYGSLSDSTNLPAGNYSLMIIDDLLGCLSAPLDVNIVTITDVVDESFVYNDFCAGTTALPNSVATAGGIFNFATVPGDGALIDPVTGLISGYVVGNSYDIIYTVGSCSESSTITVNALDLDDPNFSMADFCEGSVATPIISGLPGGIFSFNPDPGDGSIMNATSGNFNGQGGSAYSVQYLTTGACPDSITVIVNVLIQPSAPTIFATDSLYCPSDILAALSVFPSGTTTPSWTIGSSSSSPVSTAYNYTPSSLLTGNNYFFVKMVDITGCTSLPDSINYFLSDLTGMIAISDFETCLGSLAQLSANGGDSYSWNVNDDLSDLDIANPDASVDGVDTYIVQIINSDGCVVIDSITVSLLPSSECNVETYNAFSPNSDGINDYWVIDGIEGFSQNQVTIFTRWGDEVIKLDNYNNTTIVWDGLTTDDKEVPSGTYFYVVNVNGSQNEAGWVQVVK